jgi:hypothetical protein
MKTPRWRQPQLAGMLRDFGDWLAARPGSLLVGTIHDRADLDAEMIHWAEARRLELAEADPAWRLRQLVDVTMAGSGPYYFEARPGELGLYDVWRSRASGGRVSVSTPVRVNQMPLARTQAVAVCAGLNRVEEGSP